MTTNYRPYDKNYGLDGLNGYPYPSAAKQQNPIRVIRNEVAKFNPCNPQRSCQIQFVRFV